MCLTPTSAMNIAIKDNSAGCRTDVATNAAEGDWRFMFRGDYCICDGKNCNGAISTNGAATFCRFSFVIATFIILTMKGF